MEERLVTCIPSLLSWSAPSTDIDSRGVELPQPIPQSKGGSGRAKRCRVLLCAAMAESRINASFWANNTF
eukprot:962670-Prymnesium_polylepis.2